MTTPKSHGRWLGLCVVLLSSAVVPLYLKRGEEPRLLSEFGDEYESYRKRVSRIVPLPIRKR